MKKYYLIEYTNSFVVEAKNEDEAWDKGVDRLTDSPHALIQETTEIDDEMMKEMEF